MNKIVYAIAIGLLLIPSGCYLRSPRADMFAKAKEYEKRGFSHTAYLMRKDALELPESNWVLGSDPYEDESKTFQFSSNINIARRTSPGCEFRYKRKYYNKLDLQKSNEVRH